MADSPSGAAAPAASPPNSIVAPPGSPSTAATSKMDGKTDSNVDDKQASQGDKGAKAGEGEGAKAEPKAEEPSHVIKVNGKEKKVTLTELVRLAQLNENAELTTKEARELEKKARGVLEHFEKDPRGAVAQALKTFKGQELVDFAVEVLAEEQQKLLKEQETKAKEDAMDPRDKKLRDLEEKLKAIEAKEEEGKKKDHEQKVDAAHQQLTGNVISTIELLPEAWRKQEFVVNRVVDAWTWAVQNAEKLAEKNIKLTPKLIHDVVMKNLKEIVKSVSSSAKDEELDDLIDQGVRDRILKKHGSGGAAAHPALTSTPAVRDGNAADKKKDGDERRYTRAEVMRGANNR